MAFAMTACGAVEEEAPAVPKDIQNVKEEASTYVETYAKQLTDAGWGDDYVALLSSGEARDHADYESIMEVISDYRAECGATYMYVLTPVVDGEITYDVKKTRDLPFAITVDGCEDPDAWGIEYDWEIQFTEAWEGATAAARSAWINDAVGDNHDICWSAFAPVYDSEGNVVCILGIDFPCAEVLNNYPQWNRDSGSWNGIEE